MRLVHRKARKKQKQSFSHFPREDVVDTGRSVLNEVRAGAYKHLRYRRNTLCVSVCVCVCVCVCLNRKGSIDRRRGFVCVWYWGLNSRV
jgi:hypothetical protein